MSNKILQFEPFKNAKKWDDEYAKFLGNTEKYFGAKTDFKNNIVEDYPKYIEEVTKALHKYEINKLIKDGE